jgi:hypothetical protein
MRDIASVAQPHRGAHDGGGKVLHTFLKVFGVLYYQDGCFGALVSWRWVWLATGMLWAFRDSLVYAWLCYISHGRGP